MMMLIKQLKKRGDYGKKSGRMVVIRKDTWYLKGMQVVRYLQQRNRIEKQDSKVKRFRDLYSRKVSGKVFCIAGKMIGRNQDVVGIKCINEDIGKIVHEEGKISEAWKQHYQRLMNEEFVLDKEKIEAADPAYRG